MIDLETTMKHCNPSSAGEKTKFLEVWVEGRFHGAVRVKLSSVAARAILKYFDASLRAEFRDPKDHETYRYEPKTNSLYQFG
jgi:hypothetical protein